jgi:hypothetical protein
MKTTSGGKEPGKVPSTPAEAELIKALQFALNDNARLKEELMKERTQGVSAYATKLQMMEMAKSPPPEPPQGEQPSDENIKWIIAGKRMEQINSKKREQEAYKRGFSEGSSYTTKAIGKQWNAATKSIPADLEEAYQRGREDVIQALKEFEIPNGPYDQGHDEGAITAFLTNLAHPNTTGEEDDK